MISFRMISIQLGYSVHLYFWRKRGTPLCRLVWSNRLKVPSLASVTRIFSLNSAILAWTTLDRLASSMYFGFLSSLRGKLSTCPLSVVTKRVVL